MYIYDDKKITPVVYVSRAVKLIYPNDSPDNNKKYIVPFHNMIHHSKVRVVAGECRYI